MLCEKGRYTAIYPTSETQSNGNRDIMVVETVLSFGLKRAPWDRGHAAELKR